ncbi:hypothetical protein PCCS19_09140 [Paenibacillus sp. CCS19]|uniref:hypothetical protein n=1 Tax=Paenibacillus sp. CCS19 TaxID=3158387 RepID=UPI00256AD227|nr:hypothetical protein [Paenibacillus cellulosilyticus]GMK37860.1 hypothetical protein PCCS19_09140 [Paenibacillus cellulosilyticus]
MSVKQKQTVLLASFVILMLAVAVTAVVLPYRSKDKAIENATAGETAMTELESGTLAPGYDLPSLPNRFLESQLYDAASWPESSSRDIVNDRAALRAAGTSRYGKLEVWSQPGEVRLQDGAPAKYKGTYTIRYVDRSGREHKLPDQKGQVLRQLPEPAVMKVIQLDGMDVLLFQPRYYRFAQGYGSMYTTYAYAITSDQEAFPLQFVYNEKSSGLKGVDSFLFDMNGPIESIGEALSAQTSYNGGRFEITWTLDRERRQLVASAVKDRSEEYIQLAEIVGHASKHIEQALGLTEADYPDGKLPDNKLGELFTNRAWSNPGFRFLRDEFAKQAEAGNTSRAFAWLPIDATYTSADAIRFTFTINLWYAIGLAGHLEVELKQQDGEWMIDDFGTLETEKFDDPNAPYNGLFMEDPLE